MYAEVPIEVVNRIREDERIRRLHTEALGRFNYLKQVIANKIAVAAQSSKAASKNGARAAPGAAPVNCKYVDESIEIDVSAF